MKLLNGYMVISQQTANPILYLLYLTIFKGFDWGLRTRGFTFFKGELFCFCTVGVATLVKPTFITQDIPV